VPHYLLDEYTAAAACNCGTGHCARVKCVKISPGRICGVLFSQCIWRSTAVELFKLHVVDALLEASITQENRGGVLYTGADGPRAGPDGPRPGARRGGTLRAGADCPRPEAGRSAAWCAARASLPDGWTVRALGPDGPRVRRGGGSRRRRLDLAPGRDPVGEERS
jgi:hypothetical protein